MDVEGEVQLLKDKKRDDLQKKKKKKVITCLAACSGHFQAENCTKRAAKQVLTFFFFFLGDLTPHAILPRLTGTNVCIPEVKLFCLTEAKSGIFDEKSGTRPEKAGRMVTLYLTTVLPVVRTAI